MFKRIHFQSLPVSDTSRALAFYTDVMGFDVKTNSEYGEDRWIFLAVPGAKTLLHFDRVDTVPKTKTPVLILVTDDVDATCETLIKRGIKIDKGPDDAPWEPETRWAIIHDTEGNMILIQNVNE